MLKGFCRAQAAFELILIWSGCLVLCANIQENLGGENRVMIVAPSLFNVWHKERRTKKKLLYFYPFGFSVLVVTAKHCEKPSSVCISTVGHVGS